MEPITHFLTGACIGRAGLNRKTAYATLAAVLAAEAADLDIVWGFAGPVEGLKHHRGITHTFIAVPFVAAAAVGATWLYSPLDQAVAPRRRAPLRPLEPGAPPRSQPQPVRWQWVYLAALISALSHILLDWTNNYGVRPFFPFNPRWYAGSFVFIAEPVLWMLLFAALIIPGILGLAEREISSPKRTPFRGRDWAIFALIGMFLLWCLRYAEHAQAEGLVLNNPITTDARRSHRRRALSLESLSLARDRRNAELLSVRRSQHPHRRHRQRSADRPALQAARHAAVEAAKQTALGKVYLDWGRWAVVQDIGQVQVIGIDPPQLPPGRTWTTVEFTDLRFGYDFRGTGNARPPAGLGGAVYIIDNHEEAGQEMGGKEQK